MPAPAMRCAASAWIGDPPARDVHQLGGRFHPAECRGVDQVLGFGGERTGEDHEIGLGQERVELVHGVHRIRCTASKRRMAPQADEVHIEGLGQLGQSSADVAQADDEERLAAELVLALGEIADHPPPDALSLVVAGLRKTAAQGQHQRHRVFGDGPSIDAAGTGEPDAALCQLFARELVGAGADRLNEAEPLRPIEELILP